MQTVVLAAGAGRRMWPFGATQSKALLPVGPEPLLARTLRQLARAAGEDVTVACGGPHDRAVRGFCARHGGARVTAPLTPTGTADTLLAAMADPDAPTLCVCADVWFPDGALAALARRAAAEPAAAHVAMAPMGAERPLDWICGNPDTSCRIGGFSGHPHGASHRVAGAFALPAAFARHLQANPGAGVRPSVGGMPHAESDLEESLNLFIAAGGTVRALVPDTAPVDLDKPWHILAANAAEVAERLRGAEGVRAAEGAVVSPGADVRAPAVLEPGATIGPGVIVRAPVYLCAGARLTDGAIVAGPSLLGPGARVEDYGRIANAVIGPRAVVGHCAEVTGVVMEGAKIVHYSEIYGVVGREVDIGAATVFGTLRFDDGASRQRVGGPDGRWETPATHANACYLGDYSRTGVNVTFHPGRSVGPYSCVGPSVLVDEDVPARTMVRLRQDVARTPWGPERYGW